jgi:hypothetical protein
MPDLTPCAHSLVLITYQLYGPEETPEHALQFLKSPH